MVRPSLKRPHKTIVQKTVKPKQSISMSEKPTQRPTPRRRVSRVNNEIRAEQKSLHNAIPKAAFIRLVREVTFVHGL